MQDIVYRFVEEIVKRNNISGKVLDIGSLDINGTVKPLFSHCEYVGLDMQEGKNVDIVADIHSVLNLFNEFDCIVCLEMLEHDNDPFRTAEKIQLLIKQNGHLIVTASGIGFPKHNYPADYWRFTKEGMMELFKNFKIIECFEDVNEVFFYGIWSHYWGVKSYKQ